MRARDIGALLIVVDAAAGPVRARQVARALNLPPDDVRAALCQLQQVGIVHSHGRRWTTNNDRGDR